jgi:hypothetical protein
MTLIRVFITWDVTPVSTASTVNSSGVRRAKRRGRGSPRWCSDDEVAVHSLAAAIHQRQAGAVVEGEGGRVLQHVRVEGSGETWQK